ncbi:MAG: type IX secretion system sortase PorU [Prevotella sp.]|nr:type IX secretion system sortase PorU [Prevotella sp.]
MRKILSLIILLLTVLPLALQAREIREMVYLGSNTARVDSTLPAYVYALPVNGSYRDSTYTATLLYPEFIDLAPSEVERYQRLSDGQQTGDMPAVSQSLSFDRKRGSIVFSFCPVVFRNGKYQFLVSFLLDIKAEAKATPTARSKAARTAHLSSTPSSAASTTSAADRYATTSVLATGSWAKIRVKNTGVYQLTDALIRKAGFSDLSKVKIYGCGGNLIPEKLTEESLKAHDDLKQVPQCIIGGKHLFYARGPVSWASKTSGVRTRNPYSSYGYYFITQNNDTVATVDSAAFEGAQHHNDDYHALYENDGYSWYPGGRNLFDADAIAAGKTKTLTFTVPKGTTQTTLYVGISGNTKKGATAQILAADSILGTITTKQLGDYDKGAAAYRTYVLRDSLASAAITIKNTGNEDIRLDYVSETWNVPMDLPLLSKVTQAPEYVYNISNQNHHGDSQADMIIIIPASQKLKAQAERLKAFHESHDGLRVNIVPADELYNEFSSGTPDAAAYRNYLKMLYDRAGTESDQPKYLLLFGNGVWDSRLLPPECKNLDADDLLLMYESENSFNEIYCYFDDSWFGLLDDGEGDNPAQQQIDVAVGRFPVANADEAKIAVDKTINYAANSNAGNWENSLVFMGDDGNNNLHMNDENNTAEIISSAYPDYAVHKVMWDAYTENSTSTGNSYPDATKYIKKLQNNGALIMDYAGHGNATQLSHEAVLKLSDFTSFANENLPLWITAACDIMAYDGVEQNIGVSSFLNANGGSMAFYGTTRTVYANYNRFINRAFLRRVLSFDSDGKAMTIGEAHRLSQNDIMLGRYQDLEWQYTNDQWELKTVTELDNTVNHLQYSLIGDPALRLNLPSMKVVIDSINGTAVASAATLPALKAGGIASVKGHIAKTTSATDAATATTATDFNGLITLTVWDNKELVTCKGNTSAAVTDTVFTYYDRTKTIYQGQNTVKDGTFAFSFAVPKDINYSNENGLITAFAVNSDKSVTAQGSSTAFTVGGSALAENDSIGPKVYAYLNSPTFVDGGSVNSTPYFVAEISDSDGINASGAGLGHDLQLVIDNSAAMTYSLNVNFTYAFNSYTEGTTWYSIPELTAGRHQLRFTAWDILNNATTTVLNFNVVKNLEPNILEITATENPAKTSTTFIISHDRAGSTVNTDIEVYDMAGRLVWEHNEESTSSDGTTAVTWNLCSSAGSRLPGGIYIYRAKLGCESSSKVSKVRKLIIQ